MKIMLRRPSILSVKIKHLKTAFMRIFRAIFSSMEAELLDVRTSIDDMEKYF